MTVAQNTTAATPDDPATTLPSVIAALGLAPHQLQIFDPAYPRFDAQRPLLVLAPQFQSARPLLAARYPTATEARAVIEAAPSGNVVASAQLDTLPLNATAWLLPALPPELDTRGIEGLRGLVERLFGPDGCDWDQAQTPETLGTYFIEESYELIDAIERGTIADIREELGDILAHVFMQTSVAQLRGNFTVEDVVDHIARKLVRRHPHVFGDVQSGSPEEIERLWEQIKAQERAERATDANAARPESALDSVPHAAPALVRSNQLIGRAERAGLGPSLIPARDELAAAIATLEVTPPPAPIDATSAIGALLWATARLARDLQVDPEQALRATAHAFTDRFRDAEDTAHNANLPLSRLPAAQRHAAWDPSPPKAH
jgi:MazG family protein